MKAVRFLQIAAAILLLSNSSIASEDKGNIFTVQGTVTVQSDGSIMLDDGSKSERYNTGRRTKYEPLNYRTSKGDVISVEYSQTRRKTGELFNAVSKITKIKSDYDDYAKTYTGNIPFVDEKLFYNYKARMFMKVDGVENEYIFYTNGDTKFINGSELEPPIWYKNFVGKNATITVERLPKNNGNGYVFLAKRVEILSDATAAGERGEKAR